MRSQRTYPLGPYAVRRSGPAPSLRCETQAECEACGGACGRRGCDSTKAAMADALKKVRRRMLPLAVLTPQAAASSAVGATLTVQGVMRAAFAGDLPSVARAVLHGRLSGGQAAIRRSPYDSHGAAGCRPQHPARPPCADTAGVCFCTSAPHAHAFPSRRTSDPTGRPRAARCGVGFEGGGLCTWYPARTFAHAISSATE
jgi:hypothetical protein